MRIHEVTSPSTHPPTLFLAGGITGCPDWQQEFLRLLRNQGEGLDLTVFNPRRQYWDMEAGEDVSRQQIRWEYAHMHQADAIAFWFPKESICPIVLFELGSWLHQDKLLFVGCDPAYPRRFDVTEQVSLVDITKPVYQSLEILAGSVSTWVRLRTKGKQ